MRGEHPPDPVTQDEEAHDGQADLSVLHLPPAPAPHRALRADFDDTGGKICFNIQF